MAVDQGHTQENDLDRTDRLPILAGVAFEEGGDDAVPMDYTASLPTIKNDFPRQTSVDLPSLAESVRSVEERIARQQSEYEALNRSYAQALEANKEATARTEALTNELTTLRNLLDAEQIHTHETEKALAERIAAAESTRERVENVLRETERHQAEANTLRETLAARDASIAQVLHSLGERDAQLASLQREHASLVPVLEERAQAGTQLASQLSESRAHAEKLAAELQATRETVTSLTAQVNVGGAVLGTTQGALAALRAQASAYLEKLRTREWRLGFDHNLFRELDAEVGAAHDSRDSLLAERDQLQQRVTELESRLTARDASITRLKAAATEDEAQRVKHQNEMQRITGEHEALTKKFADLEFEHSQLTARLAAQDETIVGLKKTALSDEAARLKHEKDLADMDGARASLLAQIADLEKERVRLVAESASKDAEIAAAAATAKSEAKRFGKSLATAEEQRTALAGRVEQMQAEAKARDEEMAVLMAHLKEARRPVDTIEAEVARLTAELAAKAASIETLTEQNRELRLAGERTRGALEEREFLIRRLERSESNNANVLGRIQTSIERLGASPSSSTANASQPLESTAELIRLDGEHKSSYPLARRTRIGRAPGCELRIDSSSVSRHHALLLLGQRETIIEDLNSTNGVIVNGRKIARQQLNDGDTVTIGEAHFRFSLSLAPRLLDAPVAEQ